MLTKDSAICIRAVDYSETSQIVTFFTKENGKVGAIAKGSKRPKSAFEGPIEVLAFGRIVFTDSSREKLAVLTEFHQEFLTLTWKNIFALNCCLFATELLNKLTDDYDPHPELFDSSLQFLQATNEHRASSIEHRDILSLLILFQLSLLKEIGLMPIWDYCVNCKTRYEMQNTSDDFYFSSSANGLICRDCEASFPDKIRLTDDAAACFADLRRISLSEQKTLNEIEKVLIGHFAGLLNHTPKMAKYVLEK